MILTAKELREQYLKPIVYAWKRGEQYIYIGGTGFGFRRMLDANHRKFLISSMQDDDIIEIWSGFNSKKEAHAAERDMRNRYHPVMNQKAGRGAAQQYSDWIAMGSPDLY